MPKKQVDERIVETRRKIASQGFSFFLLGLMLILLYRQFYLEQEFKDYGDIFVLWILGCLYVTVGGALSGLKLFGERKINLWLVPVIIATTTLGVGIYQGSVETPGEGILSFAVSLVGASVVYFLISLLYRSWEKRNIRE